MNITDTFITNILNLCESPLNEKVYSHIKYSLLDYVGCVWAGSKVLQQETQSYIATGICSQGKCSVFGLANKYSITDAAFLNGMHSHVLELDDGHRYGTLHLAAPIFSALIAVAEHEDLTYRNLIKGAVAGYETAIRLAMSMQPNHKVRGFHTTGTCGTIGVAMAVAVAMDFNFKQCKSALSAAVTSAAGVLEMLQGDSQLKPYNVGRAASDGIMAAYIGRSGFEPPEDALCGRRGFYATMTDRYDPRYLTEFDADKLYCVGTFLKPYAACRHCHPAIEAAIMLSKERQYSIEEIEKVIVYTYNLAIVGHDHKVINGVSSAKMSIPYGVAVALVKQRAGINDFTDSLIKRNDIVSLTSKVEVLESEELSALLPDKRAAIVVVETANGKYEQRVDVATGEPENPMSPDALMAKFCESMHYADARDVDVQFLSHNILHASDSLSVSQILANRPMGEVGINVC